MWCYFTSGVNRKVKRNFKAHAEFLRLILNSLVGKLMEECPTQNQSTTYDAKKESLTELLDKNVQGHYTSSGSAENQNDRLFNYSRQLCEWLSTTFCTCPLMMLPEKRISPESSQISSNVSPSFPIQSYPNTLNNKRNGTPTSTCNFLWKINLSKKNVALVWSYGEIKPSSSIRLFQRIALMKNSEFWEDMSKSKTANRVTLMIYLWLKRLIFLSFWIKLCKTLDSDGQEIKISTRIKKFHFGVKYAVFMVNEN